MVEAVEVEVAVAEPDKEGSCVVDPMLELDRTEFILLKLPQHN